MTSRKNIAIKRINKDMKEITQSPIEGIGIASIDNDPLKYVVNICLMAGLYQGYCIQLLLTFSENYPMKPPKILIYPGQAIDGQYHHHIFKDSLKDENDLHFKKFCFDLLDNDFMSTSEEHTGWNPSYTISSFLLQVQNFLCDPDMPKDHLPNESKIAELKKSMDNYKRTFIINNENGQILKKEHTWKEPYPQMYFKKDKNQKTDIKEENINKEFDSKLQKIKDNLTCFMLKVNYIDDPDIILGYPIIKCKGLGKDKYELYPIPELLTYDGFMAQIGKQDSKHDYYFDIKFKSANNEYYNYWIPIYVNRKHFEKNRTTILNSFSVIKYGAKGIKEYDFQVEQIFEILPKILNKMIIGIFKGKTSISSAFIICYFQFILLFRKLCLEFEFQYIKYLNTKLNIIHRNDYNIDKSIIPDIGDFLVLLLLCDRNIYNEKMTKMWYCLFEEFLARQMYWIFEKDDSDFLREPLCAQKYDNLKNKKNKISMLCVDIFKFICKKCFGDDGGFELCGRFFYLQKDCIIQSLKEHGNYDETLNIIYSDNSNFILEKFSNEYSKEKIKEKMDKNIISLIRECSPKIKNKLFNLYKNRASINVEILFQKIFDAHIGNKLLIITFFTQSIINRKGFMEKLENNYGIYLYAEDFIKSMKEKLDEIQDYKQLFRYVKSEFGKKDSSLEIFIKGYKKARQMGYIR